mgnify:CR=1 FL=1|jgi:hypothetical protein
MEMLSSSWFDRPFEHWLSRLRRRLDLDGLARGCGAILRSRKIGGGGELLRLALIYGPGGCSLRETAVRQSALGGVISDTAVTKRLAKAGQFLEAVLGELLSAALPRSPAPEGHRLVLVDATTINAPRSQGCDWRLHCRQSGGRFEGFELTSARGGEKLSRFDFAPGDIVVADRGYRGMAGLAHVRAAGADVLLRVGWRAYGWRDQSGAAVSLTARFDHVGPGQMDEAALLVTAPDGTTQPVRVIAFGQSNAARDAARRKTRRKSTHNHHVVDPSSLEAARHLYLMTTLTGPDWPPARLIEMYRTRWQIELAFKRLKSILHIDQLKTRDPALARSWILAHLIAAVMLEEVAGVMPDTPPLGPSQPSHPHGVTCAC